jgi:transposase InsO family protein
VTTAGSSIASIRRSDILREPEVSAVLIDQDANVDARCSFMACCGAGIVVARRGRAQSASTTAVNGTYVCSDRSNNNRDCPQIPIPRATVDEATFAYFERVGLDLEATRYAYVEQHQAKDATTAAAVLERAIAHLAGLGLAAPEAVMTDNAFVYRKSSAFEAALKRCGARHILTPAYTPRWNGKVERFVRTLKDEWAYAHEWQRSAERSRALASFLRYYNRRRPHSSLGDRPPISRVHNVRRQDS